MVYSVSLIRTLFMCYEDNPILDKDQDGLIDALELNLATAFCPYLIFDSHEGARENNEPYVLFQVTPTALDTVAIRWVFLFKRDGGYGPASWCGDDHDGDNDKATFWLKTKDQGVTWILERITLGGKILPTSLAKVPLIDYPLEWPTNSGLEVYKSSYANQNCVHPIIYQSAHKHHLYFNTDWDESDSYYSEWGCNDNVDGKGFSVLPDIKSLNPNKKYGNNVGEASFHDPPFIDKLTPYPYLGLSPDPSSPYYRAWDKRDFYEVSDMYGCWLIPDYKPQNVPSPSDSYMPVFVQHVKVISGPTGLQPSGFGKLQGCTKPLVVYDAEWVETPSSIGASLQRMMRQNIQPQIPLSSSKETLVFVLFGPLTNGKGRTVKGPVFYRIHPKPDSNLSQGNPLILTPAVDTNLGQYYWIRINDFWRAQQPYKQQIGFYAVNEGNLFMDNPETVATARMHDPNYSRIGYEISSIDQNHVIDVESPITEDNFGNNHDPDNSWNLGELGGSNPSLTAFASITNGETDYFSLSWKQIGIGELFPGLGRTVISVAAQSPLGNDLVLGIFNEKGDNKTNWHNTDHCTISRSFGSGSAVIAVKCPNFGCQGPFFYNLKVRHAFQPFTGREYRERNREWFNIPVYPNEMKVRIGNVIAYATLQILLNDLSRLIRLSVNTMKLVPLKDRLLKEAKMRKSLGSLALSMKMNKLSDIQILEAADLEKRAAAVKINSEKRRKKT